MLFHVSFDYFIQVTELYSKYTQGAQLSKCYPFTVTDLEFLKVFLVVMYDVELSRSQDAHPRKEWSIVRAGVNLK